MKETYWDFQDPQSDEVSHLEEFSTIVENNNFVSEMWICEHCYYYEKETEYKY
jgi:hypothetical protein